MGYRVLFITFWYPSAENPVEGLFIREHAKALVQAGHELVILNFEIRRGNSFFTLKRTILTEGGSTPIHRIEIRSRFHKWFLHFIPLLNLLANRQCRLITSRNFIPQIIHTNVIFPAGLIGYHLSKKFNIPLVHTEHWSGFEHFCNHRLFGKITRKAVHHAKCIMPVSAYLGTVVSKYTVKGQLVAVVPNIVDSHVYTLKSRRKEDDEIRFLAIANWQKRKVPAKRPDLIASALDHFARSCSKKVILRIVGEGNMVEKMKAEYSDLHVKTEFLGYQDKGALNRIFHESDFFVHASNFETFSIVTAEALMTGTPSVVSDLPALRELVNPVNGILARNNAGDWESAIRSAVQQNWDPQKIRDSVGSKYDSQTIGKLISDVYLKAR